MSSSALPSSTLPASLRENVKYTVLGDDKHGRVLCLADVRGRLSTFNELAQETGAVAVIHTGDFGFFGIYLSIHIAPSEDLELILITFTLLRPV